MRGAATWLHGMMNSTSDPWSDIRELSSCLRDLTPINMMSFALPLSFRSAVMNLKSRIGTFGKKSFEESIASFSDFIGKLGTSVPPESCFDKLAEVGHDESDWAFLGTASQAMQQHCFDDSFDDMRIPHVHTYHSMCACGVGACN